MCDLCNLNNGALRPLLHPDQPLVADDPGTDPAEGGSMGTATVINATGNQDVDGELWGWKWNTTNLTFSFPTSTAEYISSGYVATNGFEAFNATQQTAVRALLANMASFTNLTFTETTAANANLRFAEADSVNQTNDPNVATSTGLRSVSTAFATPQEAAYNGTAPLSARYAQGDSWYNHTSYNNPLTGSFAYAAGLMHETGHNVGLKHGHATQSGHGYTFPTLPSDHDSYEYSVMTYRQFPGDAVNSDNAPAHPTTYMQDDIAAIQYLYGANYNFRNGNNVYTWNPTTGGFSVDGVLQQTPTSNFILMTLWDGGGTDTYDFSNYTTNANINLNPGEWTTPAQTQRANLGNNGSGGPTYFARGSIANALLYNNDARSLIENAVGGSGNDSIVGNAANNLLIGGAGNDTIDGGAGNDIAGYSVASSASTLTRTASAYTVVATGLGTDTLSNIEVLRFTDRDINLSSIHPGVWRFFNTQAGGHFFTTNVAERDSVISNLPQYHFEGIGYYGEDVIEAGTVPVWRFFNTQAGGHFFTTSIGERDNVIANLPQYSFEGVGYYASAAPQGDLQAVWRFFNTQAGGHFFTASTAERDSVIANLPQYNFEGVGYYVPQGSNAGPYDDGAEAEIFTAALPLETIPSLVLESSIHLGMYSDAGY